jgi:hypothetical protein
LLPTCSLGVKRHFCFNLGSEMPQPMTIATMVIAIAAERTPEKQRCGSLGSKLSLAGSCGTYLAKYGWASRSGIYLPKDLAMKKNRPGKGGVLPGRRAPGGVGTKTA